MRSKKKKRIIIIVLAVVAVIGVIVAFTNINKYKTYQDKVEAMVFENIDFSSIPDGDYIGESDTGVIYARVMVMIENGKLVNIDILEHRHERGQAAEVITKSMVEEQRTDVDAIASATNSSRVIRKAVEDALIGANDN